MGVWTRSGFYFLLLAPKIGFFSSLFTFIYCFKYNKALFSKYLHSENCNFSWEGNREGEKCKKKIYIKYLLYKMDIADFKNFPGILYIWFCFKGIVKWEFFFS